MKLPWSRVVVPAALTGQLADDEVITALTTTDEGCTLATTRRGLWMVDHDGPRRLGWHRIAKATLEAGLLTVVPLVDVDVGSDGDAGSDRARADDMDVLRDGAAMRFGLARPAKVTDQVHNRVRRSVAASRYLPWTGAGGWVALRRVPGQDGLTTQLRLDPAADPLAPGFLAAVRVVAADLRAAPPSGFTGVD